MSGCLTLPLRLALLALLILGGVVAWNYRREIRRQVHEWTAEDGEAAARGVPTPDGAEQARRSLERLGSGGADSVVLSADAVASLAREEAERLVPGALDSVRVTLAPDELEVRALVDTRRIPVPLGPLKGVVRPAEPIEAAGRVILRKQGQAEWQVDRVRVRGVPVPRELYGRILERFGSAAEGAVVLPLPASVTGLRVTGTGVTLYGGGVRR